MFGRDKIKAITLDDLQSLDLDSVYEKSSSYNSFNAKKHDRETRKQITKLFLNWYFWLIILAFLFCLGYNWIIALLNINLLSNIPFFKSLGMNYYAIEGSSFIVKQLQQSFPDIAAHIQNGDFTIDQPFKRDFDLVIDRAAITHNNTVSIQNTLENISNFLNNCFILSKSSLFVLCE